MSTDTSGTGLEFRENLALKEFAFGLVSPFSNFLRIVFMVQFVDICLRKSITYKNKIRSYT